MMRKIFAEISRTCNKDCYYCYNSKKVKKNVIPNIVQIIDSIRILSKKNKKINLMFSGGEPTNKLAEITDLLTRLKKIGYNPTPTLITNTESLNQEFYNFAIRFKPFIVLSYNSKTPILFNKLQNILPKNHLFIRFTITPQNVGSIYKKIKVFILKRYYVGISPAYGIKWNKYKLKELSNLYINLVKLNERNCIYDFEKIYRFTNKKLVLCKSLKEPNAIDINGKIYPCHRAIYFTKLNIQKSRFQLKCSKCKAIKFCTPCIFKMIPGEGCKIRLAILPAYELVLNSRRTEMKKKAKIIYKGKSFEIPERVLKKYSISKKKATTKRNSRNFYELGESDCY